MSRIKGSKVAILENYHFFIIKFTLNLKIRCDAVHVLFIASMKVVGF